MCEYAAACDARALHIGSYGAWLTKVKQDSAKAKWLSSATKRFFTIDFNSQLFFYSQKEDRKTISQPVRFKDIVCAEHLPRTAQPTKHSTEHTFGFTVSTVDRTFELYTLTYLDATHWVDALNAARDIANGLPPSQAEGAVQPGPSTDRPFMQGTTRELSRSSLSTMSGSDPGHCGSDSRCSTDRSHEQAMHHDFGQQSSYAGAFPTPWASQHAPPQKRNPPVMTSSYSSAYDPQAPASSNGYYSAGRSAPRAVPEVSESEDAFAALDALEELAGPPPEAVQAAAAIDTDLLREARLVVAGNKRAEDARRELHDAAAAAAAAAQQAPAPPPQHEVPAPMASPNAPALAVASVAAGQSSQLSHSPMDYATGQVQYGGAQFANTGDAAFSCAPAPPMGMPVAPAPAPVSAPLGGGIAEGAAIPLLTPEPAAAPPPPVQQAYGWGDHVVQDQPLQQAWNGGQTTPQQFATYDMQGSAPLAPQAPAPLAPPAPPAPPAPAVNSACGAPLPPVAAFVSAKPQAPAQSAGGGGDDLDDLMGEVLATGDTGFVGHGLVPDFHCTGCDFQVMRIDDFVWSSDVEYMFFRNNYPTFEKLRKRLQRQVGCCAYCCQCSWKSAEAGALLVDVAEGLRWRAISC